LTTSEQVIARTGVEALPEYFGIIPMTDVPGFAVRRKYPDNLDLAHVVNREGQSIVKQSLKSSKHVGQTQW
jgi:hypothetical protein